MDLISIHKCVKIKQERSRAYFWPTMTHTNYYNYYRRTVIPICVTQMTHFLTKIDKNKLENDTFDKNNFINVNLIQKQEIT